MPKRIKRKFLNNNHNIDGITINKFKNINRNIE